MIIAFWISTAKAPCATARAVAATVRNRILVVVGGNVADNFTRSINLADLRQQRELVTVAG